MAKKITVIPPRVTKYSQTPINQMKKRRVAAYARVSTDSEEQLTSYEAQVDYYTKFIKKNSEWEFVQVYTDEGISATNTKHRDGFNLMIKDALDGKIDLIITKSVSRFARNTVDSLTAVRELKSNGIEVYFEKENIFTFDGKGELLITIMSSLAQEESRSISENVTWGCRKRFADGKVAMPYGSFLGYERGDDGTPQIVESEAKVVRKIYRLFLEGKTPTYIAKFLTDEGILTPTKRKKWSASTVESILKNEKYKGSALLQKTFTIDFLTKEKKINDGQVPQYYVEDSHPAIVSKEVYDMAQAEFEKRKQNKNYKTTAICFSGMVFCSECSSIYGSKVWHSTDKYRKVIWQCNNKFKHKCKIPHLNENILKEAFIKVFNDMIGNKEEIVYTIERTIQNLLNTKKIDRIINSAKAVLDEKSIIIRKYIEHSSRTAVPAEEYQKQFDAYAEEYDNADMEVQKLEREKTDMLERSKRCGRFLRDIKEHDLLTDFDESLFCAVVDRIVVYEDRLEFEFKNGMKIEYEF